MLDFALMFHDLFGSMQTGLWFVGRSCGIVYVKARGWRTDCMGWLDPCLRNDNLSCNPLQCRFEFVLVLGAAGFPLLCTDNEGIRFSQMSLFCPVPLARHGTNRKECPVILAHLSPRRVACTAHGAVPECWDTEPYVGNGVFDPCLS